jgi:hypothetical protein
LLDALELIKELLIHGLRQLPQHVYVYIYIYIYNTCAHAQPMHASTRVGLPLPPNWMMSGGSSGSGGQNPTPVQWTESARQGQVGTWNNSWHAWAENPQTDTDWPGWQVQQTWTPIMPPTTSAAEMQQPCWTWENPHSMGRICTRCGRSAWK